MGMGRLGYMTEHAGESLLNLNELLGVSQTNYCVHTEFVLQQAIPNTFPQPAPNDKNPLHSTAPNAKALQRPTMYQVRDSE